MNYYPFHIGDYRSATMHLTNDEDLAYRRLLDFYYDAEAAIPVDTQWVSRRLRMDAKHIETVLRDFFRATPEGWVHDRCAEIIAEYTERAERARRNGVNGGRRKPAPPLEKNPAGSDSVPTSNPGATQPLANQEPITKNQEPKIERQRMPRGTRLPADFALPDDWIEFAEKSRPDLNPYDTGQRFIDHWHAKPGKDATKLDWFATWRNWVRGERARPAAPLSVQRESFRERDERMAMDKYEEITGKVHPKRAPAHPPHAEVIDVTPSQMLIGGDV